MSNPTVRTGLNIVKSEPPAIKPDLEGRSFGLDVAPPPDTTPAAEPELQIPRGGAGPNQWLNPEPILHAQPQSIVAEAPAPVVPPVDPPTREPLEQIFDPSHSQHSLSITPEAIVHSQPISPEDGLMSAPPEAATTLVAQPPRPAIAPEVPLPLEQGEPVRQPEEVVQPAPPLATATNPAPVNQPAIEAAPEGPVQPADQQVGHNSDTSAQAGHVGRLIKNIFSSEDAHDNQQWQAKHTQRQGLKSAA